MWTEWKPRGKRMMWVDSEGWGLRLRLSIDNGEFIFILKSGCDVLNSLSAIEYLDLRYLECVVD